MLAALRVSTFACVASLMGLAGVGYILSRPDGLIERTYAQAFDRQEAARDEVQPLGRGGFDPAHVHLSRLPVASPANAVAPAFAIGDHITLAQRTGGAAAYEVIDVRPLPGAALGEAGRDLPQLLVITAVSTGRLPTHTVRFIVEAGARGEAVPQVKPHAL